MLDQRLQQHRSSGGERWEQRSVVPRVSPRCSLRNHLGYLNYPLLSKLLLDLGLARGSQSLAALSYHMSWQRPRPSHLLDSVGSRVDALLLPQVIMPQVHLEQRVQPRKSHLLESRTLPCQ